MRRKERILIVDDDPEFVRFEQRLLAEQYTLLSAATGTEALRVMPTFNPDLILLDVDMPGIDGYETCRRFRQMEDEQIVKIFMVSAGNTLEERLEAYRAGADEVVVKPYSADEFLAKIRVFMRLRHIEEIERIKSSLLALLSAEALGPSSSLHRLISDVLEDGETPDHIRQYVSPILQSAADFNQLAEKAARLHQLERGVPLNPYRDTLRDHLTFVARRLESFAEKKKIRFQVTCPGHLAFKADWKALDEVFGYILDNAVRYSGTGNEIDITAIEGVHDCRVLIEDHGKGIEPDRMPSIFTSFAVDDLDHHHEGQRLSLAIAKQLVELHHGNIEVASAPGKGTSVRITLPTQGQGAGDDAKRRINRISL